jgi:hypothetical protein
VSIIIIYFILLVLPNPALLRRGKVLPLYSKGESERAAHAIATFQISLAMTFANRYKMPYSLRHSGIVHCIHIKVNPVNAPLILNHNKNDNDA